MSSYSFITWRHRAKLFPNKENIEDNIDPYFYFEGFTSIPTALAANDRNRRIQVNQARDG